MNFRFSTDIKVLLERLAEHPLTLEDILSETSERGFSLVIFLLTLPFLFPMPPGLTTILGLGSLLLGLQMAGGMRKPWLPKKVGQFVFPQGFISQLLKNLQKVTAILEKIARPRLPKLAANPYIWRFNGICIAWLVVLLMLPIPLTNPIPTVPILLLTVATLESDGLLMCFSYGLTIAVSLFFGFIFYALWQAPALLPSIFK
jgi:hypothetical protein